ncbi:MAG: chemotaxis response regulator protein-glutamate methylesterase [Oligoflexia bacterium]|nr:chemotaxis response regulator protein-glutamate methylesterase [Oligoflexia bacterium]
MAINKIKVLIIDDSALVRHILKSGLANDPEIEVVGMANDPFEASERIVELRPDVLTLDVEMPKMDGIEFLKQLLPQYPIPVIMISSSTERGSRITMQALEVGAVDFLTKSRTDIQGSLNSLITQLRAKIKMAAKVDVRKMMNSLFSAEARVQEVTGLDLDKVIAIGVSTGGFETMRYILKSLPRTMPGMVVTQHMPPGYTKTYAERLSDCTQLNVVEAKDGDQIFPGKVLVAPGGLQMEVEGKGTYTVRCYEGEKVNGHCPSVDVLFNSMAKRVGRKGIGLILTGMGDDGADGMLAMKNAGAHTIAQDEESSVVFGMPKMAIERGATKEIVSLKKIPDKLIATLVASGNKSGKY